jgi:hypothetical protein
MFYYAVTYHCWSNKSIDNALELDYILNCTLGEVP